jgi:hypothetical protein
MRLNKRILASVLAAGAMTGGMLLQSTSANATPGNAKAKVTVGGKTYKLSGGACVISGSKLEVGVGATPNSLGINGTLHKGKFKNAEIGAILSGNSVAVTSDSGTANSKGGKFKGTDAVTGGKVSGSFTC